MREKSWKKGLKIGAMALMLLLLIGGVLAGSVAGKTESNQPPHISEKEEKEIIKNLEKLRNNVPTSIKDGISVAGDWGCDVWPSSRVVCNSYPVYFEMSNSASKVYFKGIYVSVWSGSRINQGTLLGEHTYTTYKSPTTILSEMRQLHPGYNPSVHIKYFVQGQTRYWALVSSQGWSGVGYDRYIELWSEANYNYVGGWETWGVPL